jgi:hypothetical protein
MSVGLMDRSFTLVARLPHFQQVNPILMFKPFQLT